MFGSGVTIGTTIIIVPLLVTQKVLSTGRSVSIVAMAGTASTGTASRRIAATSALRLVTTT